MTTMKSQEEHQFDQVLSTISAFEWGLETYDVDQGYKTVWYLALAYMSDFVVSHNAFDYT